MMPLAFKVVIVVCVCAWSLVDEGAACLVWVCKSEHSLFKDVPKHQAGPSCLPDLCFLKVCLWEFKSIAQCSESLYLSLVSRSLCCSVLALCLTASGCCSLTGILRSLPASQSLVSKAGGHICVSWAFPLLVFV